MPDGLHGLIPEGEWRAQAQHSAWKEDRKARGLAAEDRVLRPPTNSLSESVGGKFHRLRDQLKPNLAIVKAVLRNPFGEFEHPDHANMLAFKDAYRHCQVELSKMTSAYEVLKRSGPITQITVTNPGPPKTQPSTQDVLAFTSMQQQRDRAEAQADKLKVEGETHRMNYLKLQGEYKAFRIEVQSKLSKAEHVLSNQKMTSFERIINETE